MHDSPTQPRFWNSRYESSRTPWDTGGVPPALSRYLSARPGRNATVLIPGCGSGYEIAAFRGAGYRVQAIDFSPAAIARARVHIDRPDPDCLIQGDFFTHDFGQAPFDVIYERTFLCALPPDWWLQILRRAAELLKPGGDWIGIFVLGPKEDGPPFGFASGEQAELFAPFFTTVVDEPIPPAESLPLFAGQERWQEHRRRGVPESP